MRRKFDVMIDALKSDREPSENHEINTIEEFPPRDSYVLMAAGQVGFDIKNVKVYTTGWLKKPIPHDSHEIEFQVYQKYINSFAIYKGDVSELKRVFDSDVVMNREFGPCPSFDEESVSFSYESLSNVPTYELHSIKNLIERIQTLISSSILYDDFRMSFEVLSGFNYGNFIDEDQKVDSRRFKTLRGRKLLAIYIATSNASFFNDKRQYDEFIKCIMMWLIQIVDRISQVLSPSQKLGEASRYQLNHQPLFLKQDKLLFMPLILRYRAFLTMCYFSKSIDLESFRDSLYLMTMEDQNNLELAKISGEEVKYYRIRKVFIDFLFGKIVTKKNGWIILTKEIIFMEKVCQFENPDISWMYTFRRNEQYQWLETFMRHNSMTHWAFNFRKVGPKITRTIDDELSRLELGSIQKSGKEALERGAQSMSIKDRLIPPGLFTRPLLHTYSCFPHYWQYSAVIAPLSQEGVFLNLEDRRTYMEVIRTLYTDTMKTLQLIREICSNDRSD